MNRVQPNGADRALGCFYGMGLGDALGYPTEFVRDVDEIHRRWPPDGPRVPRGNPILVTDDTQMALAVARALERSAARRMPVTPERLEKLLREEFVAWANDPQNNRAPGMTCLSSCRNLEMEWRWVEATDAGSKGCGANMRVMPVGLLVLCGRLASAAEVGPIAQFQAALTHGHPTALAAADLTAFAVASLASGLAPENLLQACLDRTVSQEMVYHEEWLSTLWQRPGGASASDFIRRGWLETRAALEKIPRALALVSPPDDPCQILGGGWIAEECLACALYCFLQFPEDPMAVIHRGAVTSGDSDSIACIAGSLAGVYHGAAVWPKGLTRNLEYRDEMHRLARFFSGEGSR